MNQLSPRAALTEHDRAVNLFQEHRHAIFRETDRIFAGLLVIEWLAACACAVWLSPMAWAGLSSSIHPHVGAAVLLGGLVVSLPILLTIFAAGSTSTRQTIAIAQMFMSILLIHLSGGRIEVHFHIFGSLAFLSFYRDWKVLVTATVVIATDHVLRGIYWPQSAFGVSDAGWRWLEHAGWVVFEDIFLILSCIRGVNEMWGIAERQAVIGTAIESLGEAGETLTEVSDELSDDAHATALQAVNVAAASEQVSENLQSVNVAVEQMEASIREIARNAAEAARVAESAVMSSMVANDCVAQLGRSSQEIGEVINTITAITFKTHLVALNASIEAARAGEAGRGFAVVSDAIADLAKQIEQAAEDIRLKVGTAQEDAAKAAQGLRSISTVIGQINDLSNSTSASIEQQRATTNAMARDLSEATRGSLEISGGIAEVAQATRHTTEAAESSQDAAASLAEISAQLQRLVSRGNHEPSNATELDVETDGETDRRSRLSSIRLWVHPPAATRSMDPGWSITSGRVGNVDQGDTANFRKRSRKISQDSSQTPPLPQAILYSPSSTGIGGG